MSCSKLWTAAIAEPFPGSTYAPHRQSWLRTTPVTPPSPPLPTPPFEVARSAGTRVPVRREEDVVEGLPSVQRVAGAAVVAVDPQHVGRGGNPRGRASPRSLVRPAHEGRDVAEVRGAHAVEDVADVVEGGAEVGRG